MRSSLFICAVAPSLPAGLTLIYCLFVTGGCAHNISPGSTLVAANHVNHLDALAREPMVTEHPDGTLFVAGYCGPDRIACGGSPGPRLWKSRDHGRTWTRVNVGNETDGAVGNSDVDLAIARDGSLYFVTMDFDDKANEGRRIAIGISRDAGVTWRWTLLSRNRFDDRPWVAAGPDGTVHVIWNDGSGVRYAVSHDRGITWQQRPRINPVGGSSHLAVGPNGEVAVRVVPLSASGSKFHARVDLIAVSDDGGVTWQKRPAPGERPWSPASETLETMRWVEPVAWDASGSLYSFWAERKALWLARSVDRGKTWTQWHVADTAQISYYPYLVARERGELAATWFSDQGDMLQAHVARLNFRNGDALPQMVESAPFQPEAWTGGDTPTRDTAGEYFGVALLSKGGLGVVSPFQQWREKRFGFSWWTFELR